jgi:hypothetical protein
MNKKQTVGASVTTEMKERIKRVAQEKYWSVGQTLGLFIEKYWDEWEKELGVETQTTPKKKAKATSKTE